MHHSTILNCPGYWDWCSAKWLLWYPAYNWQLLMPHKIKGTFVPFPWMREVAPKWGFLIPSQSLDCCRTKTSMLGWSWAPLVLPSSHPPPFMACFLHALHHLSLFPGMPPLHLPSCSYWSLHLLAVLAIAKWWNISIIVALVLHQLALS